jgi:hypothetical protein
MYRGGRGSVRETALRPPLTLKKNSDLTQNHEFSCFEMDLHMASHVLGCFKMYIAFTKFLAKLTQS